MMSKLWGWIAAVGAALLAALYYMAGQRDKAREEQRQAEAKAAISEATRSTENRIREAQQQARKRSTETERQRDERPETQRPSGMLRRD